MAAPTPAELQSQVVAINALVQQLLQMVISANESIASLLSQPQVVAPPTVPAMKFNAASNSQNLTVV